MNPSTKPQTWATRHARRINASRPAARGAGGGATAAAHKRPTQCKAGSMHIMIPAQVGATRRCICTEMSFKRWRVREGNCVYGKVSTAGTNSTSNSARRLGTSPLCQRQPQRSSTQPRTAHERLGFKQCMNGTPMPERPLGTGQRRCARNWSAD